MTGQEVALETLRDMYGKEAFTEDCIAYRRVGFKNKLGVVSAIGDTWQEAMGALAQKARALAG
jgi:hypothetical protein